MPIRPDFRLPADLLHRFVLALKTLYASILTERMPPRLQRLVDALRRRT